MTWQIAAFALTAASAYQSIQQGKAQQTAYELQAAQTRLKAEREALQYEQAATETYRRLALTNANAAARGFSGGVQGFSGSAKLIQQVNETRAGRDINVIEQNKKFGLSFADIQSNIFKDAGEQAVRGSYFDAAAKLGTAVYMYNYQSPLQTPAPIEERTIKALT